MKPRRLGIATACLAAFIALPAQFALSCGPMVILPPGKFEGTWQIVKKEVVSSVDKASKNQSRFNDEILYEEITLDYGDPIKVAGPGIFKNCSEATYDEVPAEHRFKGSEAEFDKAVKDKTIDLGKAELKLHCISKDTSGVEVIFNMTLSTGQASFTLDNMLYTMQFIEKDAS